METVPLKFPFPVGRESDVYIARLMQPKSAPQLLVSEEYVPVMVRLAMCSVVFPTSVMIDVNVFCCPTVTVPKFKLDGLSSTTVPTPVRLTICGLPAALSVMTTAPVRVPPCVGVKITLMVQLAKLGRLEPQVLDWLKSPVVVMLVISRVISP